MESPSPFLIDSWSLGIVFYQLFTEKPHAFNLVGVARNEKAFLKVYKDQQVSYTEEFFLKN